MPKKVIVNLETKSLKTLRKQLNTNFFLNNAIASMGTHILNTAKFLTILKEQHLLKNIKIFLHFLIKERRTSHTRKVNLLL